MNTRLEERLSLFVENTQDMRKEFVWQNTLSKRLAALLYAMEDKQIDVDSIHQCYEWIKSHTGIFSTFRGNMALNIATLLSLSNDRERVFSNAVKVYELMKNAKFAASDYLVVAAYQIAAHAQPDQYSSVVERARAFYDGMKTKHWFITGKDDYIYCAMLGMSDVEVNEGLERMERLYSQLKQEFYHSNSVQTLSQLLVLGGENDAVIQRLDAMNATFRGLELRLDKEYTLPSLGLLALLHVDDQTVANEISDVIERLSHEKGFGAMSLTKQERLMLAAALAASAQAAEAKQYLVPALTTSIANIIIAQQAMMAAVAASSAAAAASSSSGS